MTVTYCTDATIKSTFGTTNANTWADLDNDNDSTKKTARYDAFRVAAHETINNRLRQTHYRLPFSPVPQEIQQLEAELAGVGMMTARGLEDNGPSVAVWQKKSEETFAGILSGSIRLDAP